jgi:serine/threonine protein kinase
MIEMYQSFKNADSEVAERVLRVKNLWIRIQTQLDFMKKIENSLSSEHYEVQTETLGVLAGKLGKVCTRLDALLQNHSSQTGPPSAKEISRWRYTLSKSSLDKTIRDLTSWQEMYDPTWYLMAKIGHHMIDAELIHAPAAVSAESLMGSMVNIRDSLSPQPQRKVHVFLPPSGLDYTQAREISFSSAKLLPRSQSTKLVIVDSVPCNEGSDPDIKMKDIRELAVKLSNANPSVFGMLKCLGVIKDRDVTGHLTALHLVFDLPETENRKITDGISCSSLRGHLNIRGTSSLTARFEIARQLAKSINYVHALGFVHKDVRPENFIGFDRDPVKPGPFYLIGFERVRTADGRTYHLEDMAWFKAIYRHPDRQGPIPRQDYCMQHDIYGLGVCLLEIGLWDSFLSCDDSNVTVSTTSFGIATEHLQRMTANDMKVHIVELARARLPSLMGVLYTGIVVNCLTCLDSDNNDFGDRTEFEDSDGVLVGVRYIQKVSHDVLSFIHYQGVEANDSQDLVEA